MKIRISDISEQGLHIVDTLPVDALNARMNEGSNNDIFFPKPPTVDITVRRTVRGAHVRGTVQSAFKQGCSRCDQRVARALATEIDIMLEPKSKRSDADSFSDDQVGVVYYENDAIDLEDLLQETIILDLSPFWHPPFNEQDRCTECGKSTHELFKGQDETKNTLGSLLMKAGIESGSPPREN